KHPERTFREVRRDYGPLVRSHARRAGRILAPSRFTAGEIQSQLGVPAERIVVCSPGAPDWAPRDRHPENGYVLFIGTLEPRKNLGALLDAYEELLRRSHGPAPVPNLVVAGQAIDQAHAWLDRMARPPLDRVVRHQGYVEPAHRRALYEGARALVMPSF